MNFPAMYFELTVSHSTVVTIFLESRWQCITYARDAREMLWQDKLRFAHIYDDKNQRMHVPSHFNDGLEKYVENCVYYIFLLMFYEKVSIKKNQQHIYIT